MRNHAWGKLLVFVCLITLTACGSDDTAQSGSGGDAGNGGVDGTGSTGASDGGVPDGSLADDADCGCVADSCGGAGLCLCTTGNSSPVCLCDTGYAGASCGNCAPGYVLSEQECLRELRDTRTEAAGDNCVAGGFALVQGLDADGNGTLSDTEITATEYLCQPEVLAPCEGSECCSADSCNGHGVCVDSAAGPQCTCSSGYAGAACAVCAVGNVMDASGACLPPARLTESVIEPRGESCPSGGRRVRSGLDLNADGVLDEGEVTLETLQCSPAQVITGDVTVTNQAELDALRGVTEIRGALTIQADYIQDLSPLTGLTFVQGVLSVDGCAELKSIQGLDRLEQSGGLLILDNPLLAGLGPLEQLVRVKGDLRIERNPKLTSLAGLDVVQQVDGSFSVLENERLGGIDALAALAVVGQGLQIADNAALSHLDGLTQLHSVGGELELLSNPVLVQVGGLSGLTDTGGLRIWDNAALPSTAGLESLRSIRGDLMVRENAALTDFVELPNLISIEGEVWISRNPVLTTLPPFAAVRRVGAISINGNEALQEVDAFHAVEELTGTLITRFAFGVDLSTTQAENILLVVLQPIDPPAPYYRTCIVRDAQDLPEGRPTARCITSSPLSFVHLSGQPSLVSVKMLSALSDQTSAPQLGAVRLKSHPVLTRIEIGNLTSPGSGEILELRELPLLVTLRVGAASFTSVVLSAVGLETITAPNTLFASSVRLSDLPNLTTAHITRPDMTDVVLVNLPSLSDLVIDTLATVTTLTLDQLPALTTSLSLPDFIGAAVTVSATSIGGLDAPLVTQGSLDVIGNPELTTLTYGKNADLGSVSVIDNDKLQSLTSLNLRSVTGSLIVADHAALGVVRFDSLRTLGGMTIRGNAVLGTVAGILPAATSLNGLIIENNDSLADVAGVCPLVTQLRTLTIKDNLQLSSVAGTIPTGLWAQYVTISGNPALQTLAGLIDTRGRMDSLTISGNSALTDLGSLTTLSSLNSLSITDCDGLTSLNGFPPNLSGVNYMTVSRNGNLQSLTTVQPTVSRELRIEDNPKLPQCLATAYGNIVGPAYPKYISGNDTNATCN